MRSDADPYVAVEVPPGSPQIAYQALARTWCPRGGVLRCLIEDDREKGVIVYIDNHELSEPEFGKLLMVYSGWGMRITFVPEDELHDEPNIAVREPERKEYR